MGALRSNQYRNPLAQTNGYLSDSSGGALSYYSFRYGSRTQRSSYGVPASSNRWRSLSFATAPANLAQISLRDRNDAAIVFEFVYAGTTPSGAGTVVPLIAGGGTAAQAAAALKAAYEANITLPLFFVEILSATPTLVTFISRTPARTFGTFAVVTGVTAGGTSTGLSKRSSVLPGMVGGRGVFLPGQTII